MLSPAWLCHRAPALLLRIVRLRSLPARPTCPLQLEPPGMQIVYLPFADDIREAHTDTGFTGTAVRGTNTGACGR